MVYIGEKIGMLIEKFTFTCTPRAKNEQTNIVHGVVESKPSVLNLVLVENRPAKRPRATPRKNLEKSRKN